MIAPGDLLPPGAPWWNESTGATPGEHISRETFHSIVTAMSWSNIFICFLSLLSNVLVFVLIATTRMLQTPTNALVASLSAADLLYSAIMIPNYLAALSDTIEMYCFFESLFPILCSLASAWSLLTISADRYLSVRLPFRYRLWLGWRDVLCAICVVWGIALGLTLSLFIPAPHDEIIHALQCARYFYPTMVYFLFYVAFMLMAVVGAVVFYFNIISIARQADRRSRKETDSLSTSSQQEVTSAASFSARKLSVVRVSVHVAKSTRQFCQISVIFLIVWLPMIVMTMVFALCENCRGSEVSCLRKATELLYAIALLANPWIYTLRTLDFRLALRRLCCHFRCCAKRSGSVESRDSVSHVTSPVAPAEV